MLGQVYINRRDNAAVKCIGDIQYFLRTTFTPPPGSDRPAQVFRLAICYLYKAEDVTGSMPEYPKARSAGALYRVDKSKRLSFEVTKLFALDLSSTRNAQWQFSQMVMADPSLPVSEELAKHVPDSEKEYLYFMHHHKLSGLGSSL